MNEESVVSRKLIVDYAQKNSLLPSTIRVPSKINVTSSLQFQRVKSSMQTNAKETALAGSS